MAKSCLQNGCNNPRFGGGYCVYHQYNRKDKIKTVLKRTPIRKISKKRKSQMTIYLKERTKFLDGKICPVTNQPATEIHHTNGRENERLNDKKYWLAVTRKGHQYIHANLPWAREKGFMI